jgi:hypothetical protein
MTISYPLSLPSTRNPRRITFEMLSSAGMSTSPFSLSQQVYENPGEAWGATLELGEMNRSDAEAWVAFMASLRGRYGTVLIGDPIGATPQGTWAGSPLVNGAHAAQVRTVAVDGFTVGATGKAGDWIQFGTGSSHVCTRCCRTSPPTARGRPRSRSGRRCAMRWPTTPPSSPRAQGPLPPGVEPAQLHDRGREVRRHRAAVHRGALRCRAA